MLDVDASRPSSKLDRSGQVWRGPRVSGQGIVETFLMLRSELSRPHGRSVIHTMVSLDAGEELATVESVATPWNEEHQLWSRII